jgi:hypothetical protein
VCVRARECGNTHLQSTGTKPHLHLAELGVLVSSQSVGLKLFFMCLAPDFRLGRRSVLDFL